MRIGIELEFLIDMIYVRSTADKNKAYYKRTHVMVFAFYFLLVAVSRGKGIRPTLCWTEQPSLGVDGAVDYRWVGGGEEGCKNECVAKSGACYGIDWNYETPDKGFNGCWLQLTPNLTVHDKPQNDHWSLANCFETTVADTTTQQATTTITSTTPIATTTTVRPTTKSTSETQSRKDNSTASNVSAAKSTPPTAIIAGVVGGVGGSLFLVLLILVIICLAKKRRKDKHDDVYEPKSPNQDVEKALNPSKTNLFTLIELGNHFQHLNNTKEGLKDEFSGLPSGNTELCTAAKLPANKKKNRFKNIWPYDANRIKLSVCNNDENSDYINANYIEGFCDPEDSYIAAQGPLETTLNDFWRMIWEEDINRIVMLTLPVEEGKRKCEQYWPESVDDSKTFDKITVTLTKCDYFAECTRRIMKIEYEHDSEPRLVTQLQCLVWKDKSVPSDVYAVLAFRDQVRLLDLKASGPMLVHCSAGVGRTGTFIATDILIEQAEKGERLSVFEVVKKLREQRMSMVQVLDQYKLLYLVLLEWKNSGTTGISWHKFEKSFGTATKIENFPDVLKSRAEKEFNLLLEVKSSAKDEVKSAGHQPQNENKNRDMNTVPADSVRIYLSETNNQSNYINAVLMKGYHWPIYYILTQLPLEHTVDDFWRMIVEQKCPTIVILEPNEAKDESVYWPKEVRSKLSFGKITVTLTSKVEIGSISAFQLQLKQTSSSDSESQTVHIYQLSSWTTDENVPESSKDVLDLIGLVSNRQQEITKPAENSTEAEVHKRRPVVIVCHDGAVKSGLFAAASYLTDKMNNDRVIDAYLSCRYLLSCRPQSIVSLTQYQYLYQLAAEYCQWTPTVVVEFPSDQVDSKDVYVNLTQSSRAISLYANGHLYPDAATPTE